MLTLVRDEPTVAWIDFEYDGALLRVCCTDLEPYYSKPEPSCGGGLEEVDFTISQLFLVVGEREIPVSTRGSLTEDLWEPCHRALMDEFQSSPRPDPVAGWDPVRCHVRDPRWGDL